MQPDRQIELRHGRENRLEGGFVERPAGDVGEDLDAAGAELLHRAPRLRDRALHVGHRHRGDEGRESARDGARTSSAMASLPMRARFRPDLAGGKVLDRRVRQRDDLAVIAELVHLAEALVEIEQLFHAPQPRRDVAQPRRDAIHLLEELVGEDVAVDVDDRLVGHRSSLFLRPHPEERARGKRSRKLGLSCARLEGWGGPRARPHASRRIAAQRCSRRRLAHAARCDAPQHEAD